MISLPLMLILQTLNFSENMNNFYKKLITIALPITIQSVIISSINMIDVFMVGKLGETKIAALGLSNQLMFLFILFLFGINSGSSIFTAQFFGKGDKKSLHNVLGLSILLSLSMSALFFILAYFFPKEVIGLYSKDPLVIEAAAKYLKITALSYPMTAISFAYAMQLRSVDSAALPMITSFFALIINGFGNWLLIFGNLGFPEMGIEGAALATTIARSVECMIMVLSVYVLKKPLASNLKELFLIRKDIILKYLKFSFPVLINEIIWALGITGYNIVYARMGTREIAAINIENSIERLAFVAFIGLANAAAAILGQELGKGKNKIAEIYAKKLINVTLVISISISIFLLVFGPELLSLYDISDGLFQEARVLIYVFALILPMRAFNALNIVGILRSGGDTKAALYIDVGALWLVSVPLTALGGLYFGLPLWIVFLFTGSEELFKFIFGFHRYKTKKWIKNLVTA